MSTWKQRSAYNISKVARMKRADLYVIYGIRAATSHGILNECLMLLVDLTGQALLGVIRNYMYLRNWVDPILFSG